MLFVSLVDEETFQAPSTMKDVLELPGLPVSRNCLIRFNNHTRIRIISHEAIKPLFARGLRRFESARVTSNYNFEKLNSHILKATQAYLL